MDAALSLPLVAALMYGTAALLLKKVAVLGIGQIRVVFIANWAAAIILWVAMPVAWSDIPWSDLAPPLITAIFFFLGNAFTFWAIRVGDVSVVTPAMGLKVIFVALLSAWFFEVPMDRAIQAGVGLAAVGVVLLGVADWRQPRRIVPALILAAISAFFFAVSDTLVSQWAPAMGREIFLPILFLAVALYSFLLLPFFTNPLHVIPARGWLWVLIGAGVLGLQAMLFNLALSVGDATVANILFSSRGFWAFLLVLTLGPLLGNREGGGGVARLGFRLLGTLILFAAVALVLQ